MGWCISGTAHVTSPGENFAFSRAIYAWKLACDSSEASPRYVLWQSAKTDGSSQTARQCLILMVPPEESNKYATLSTLHASAFNVGGLQQA